MHEFGVTDPFFGGSRELQRTTKKSMVQKYLFSNAHSFHVSVCLFPSMIKGSRSAT